MSTLIQQTNRWFVHAGQQPAMPHPDAKQLCLYIGLQLEEIEEKIRLIYGCPLGSLVDLSAQFKAASPTLQQMAYEAMSEHPAEMLDADMDLIWVTLGSARAQGANAELGYALVTQANWAKFPDGVVTKDSNGKVQKPAGWVEPDLTPATHPNFKQI